MNQQPEPASKRDPDLVNAEVALQRAAQKARDRARCHGVAVVYYENGQIVKEIPKKDHAARK